MRSILFLGTTWVFLLFLSLGARPLIAEEPVIPSKPEDVHPLQVGDSIPDGTLRTLSGKKVGLRSLLGQKPTVIIFYRGGWCPYCNLQMGQLVKLEPELEGLGIPILAISPDRPAKLKESLKKHHITYLLLSDSSMEVAEKFNLAYKLDPETIEKMKGLGVDLENATGNSLHLLPVPAAYVVDSKGVIRFAYYNPDIKVRVNPAKLLKAAESSH